MARGQFKRNLTTGEIAELCGVNFRTVIRWIQRGHLKAFQLPGRGDNRVPVEHFIEFLRSNQMPIPPELRGESRAVMLVGFSDEERIPIEATLHREGFDVVAVSSEFDAGVEAGRGKPGATVIAADSLDGESLSRLIPGLLTVGSGIVICGGSKSASDIPGSDTVVRLETPVDWSMLPAIVEDMLAGSI